jgi:site-specific DNA-methyltransferase (adenine-specific)
MTAEKGGTEMSVILGDCLDVMKTFPDNHFDVIITDPPYGIGESAKKNNSRCNAAFPTRFESYSWDEKKIGMEYFYEMKRISKDQVIFGGNYYCSFLGDTSCFIVWDKQNTGDFADCELAWTSFKTATRLIKCRWNGMLQYDMKNKEKRVHPTQKPLPVMEWIIQNYSVPNSFICDPFMGSGTTGVACMKLERNFTGIDFIPEYVEIAKNRIKNEFDQLKLSF